VKTKWAINILIRKLHSVTLVYQVLNIKNTAALVVIQQKSLQKMFV